MHLRFTNLRTAANCFRWFLILAEEQKGEQKMRGIFNLNKYASSGI